MNFPPLAVARTIPPPFPESFNHHHSKTKSFWRFKSEAGSGPSVKKRLRAVEGK